MVIPNITPKRAAKFWSYVAKSETCWLWIAGKIPQGYGQFGLRTVEGKATMFKAHRIAWQIVNGPIGAGLFVCHKCDVRACVNPDHLFLGTHKENMRDMASKGRSPGAIKLSGEDVEAMRAERAATGVTYRELGHKYGVSHVTAYSVINRLYRF